jgi:chemotaxis protein MotB
MRHFITKHIRIFFMMTFAISGLYSCVPGRQYEDLKAKNQKCEQELAAQKADGIGNAAKVKDLEEQIALLDKRMKSLQSDTLIMGKSLRIMTVNYDKLNQTYELLLAKGKDMLDNNKDENKKIMTDLQSTQEQLQTERDALRILKSELDSKGKNLEGLQKELENSQAELKVREQKVKELQTILSQKDSIVNSIKKKVTDALLGYENNGLTIEKKNGKVYVSLEERLLFASGSTTVDQKGAEALKKLAKVLEQNADINVLIEGHTDNVPYNSSGGAIKDNWDLSVLRATSIVKIILKDSSIDPKRLTPAGHGEYFPLDAANNAEARKKNRRTEIILTPKLDEILKILENQ